jgi:hypothetical protein
MSSLRSIVSWGSVLSVLIFGTAQATPLYYTFEGTATQITDPIGESGVSIGDSLGYVFLIDFDLGGTVTNLDGSVSLIETAFPLYEPSIPYDASTMDNFYVDYLSGDAYFGASGVANNFLELNTGVNYPDLSRYTITGGDALGIASFQDPVQLWSIGDEFFSFNVWGNESERIIGNVTLVSISQSTSVPEPSSIALMGLSLAGLGFMHLKKARRSY